MPVQPPDPNEQDQDSAKAKALQLEYEYLRSENLRLRDARGSITRQLGPLPISAAIVAGLVTGFTTKVHDNVWLYVAGGIFFVMVIISICYSNMKPYRAFRRDREQTRSAPPRSTSSARAWYEDAIAFEESVYGQARESWWKWHLPKAGISGLQEGYDRERSGLYLIQILFAIVVTLLIISRLA